MHIGGKIMAQIKDEKQYKAIMTRIDELFFETDERTPAEDPRLQELDMLSALVEEYEKEHCNIRDYGPAPMCNLKRKGQSNL